MKVTSYLDFGEGFDDGVYQTNLSAPFEALVRDVGREICPSGGIKSKIRVTVAFESRLGRWKVKGRADTLPDVPEPLQGNADTEPAPGHGTAIVTRDGSLADPADGATLVAGLKAAAEAIKVGLGGGPYQVEPMLTATATDNAGGEWKVVANLTQPVTVQLTAHEIGQLIDAAECYFDTDPVIERLRAARDRLA